MPNLKNCHTVLIMGGVFYDVESLLEHIDAQLGTNFNTLNQMDIEESYDKGRADLLAELGQPTAAVSQDHDALHRIQTAETTGYAPEPHCGSNWRGSYD